MPSLHEVVIGQGAEEPQLCIVSHNFPGISRSDEHFAMDLDFAWHFGLKDGANVEWLPKHVNGSVWQFVANKPSPANLNWIRVSAAKIGEVKPLKAEILGFSLVILSGFSPSELTRLNANDWQFEGNGSSSAEIGGIGGDACSPIRAQQKIALASGNEGQQCSEYSQHQRVETDGIGRHPKRLSAFVVFCFFIGGVLLGCCGLLVVRRLER